jgi:hypothetical protein
MDMSSPTQRSLEVEKPLFQISPPPRTLSLYKTYLNPIQPIETFSTIAIKGQWFRSEAKLSMDSHVLLKILVKLIGFRRVN